RVVHDDRELCIPPGEGPWPNLERTLFHHERIYPVAAPGHFLARPDTKPGELVEADADLLFLAERHRARFDWDEWFDLHQLTPSAAANSLRFSDYSLVVRAALAGQGVALGWHHIVRNLIVDGLLARVGMHEVITDHPFVLLTSPSSARRPAVRAL